MFSTFAIISCNPATEHFTFQPFSCSFCFVCVACRNHLLQAFYKTRGGGTWWETTIYLPPNASSNSIVVGDPQTNSKAAKNAAALKAIKQLHAEKHMNAYLHPSWGSNRRAKQLGKRVFAQR